MNYSPLWIKTDYTLLSSLIKIDDLINLYKENNIKTAFICDDNLCGTMEFYTKCIKNNIKPIIGLEVKLDYILLLYAKNYHGYQNLCNISTLISENKLNDEILFSYLDDLVVILPYSYIEKKDNIKLHTNSLYIGYENKEEKDNIHENKVYIKKTLCLDKEDEKYLKYLYKINDKDFIEKDVYLKLDMDLDSIKIIENISNLCNIDIYKRDDLLPVYNSCVNSNPEEYLTNLCITGLKKRLNNNISIKYVERLKYELSIIKKMGFCSYFLVVWDYVKYAKKNNIMVGPGRGSAASSLVSYTLGITDIDPIKYNLLFERFLNPNRVTMPDIDIDFDAEKKDDVIKYVTEKYGKDYVSKIVTFSNLLSKQVIRDVARIFDISAFKLDNLLNNFDDKKDLRYQLNNINVKKILKDDEKLQKVYDIALHLEGLKRHTSIHAAGIIISNKKLRDYVPLILNSDGSYLCGYTMNYIEDLGFLKMDFLSLKNLTLVDKIINSIGNINFNDIKLDDKKTYDLFLNDNLDGIFQFESLGMRRFISNLKPTNINDLISAVALFRPGPMDNIDKYILRKNNKEKVSYIHEDLKDILKDTYGIIIYQEQIMQIASKMAGFSYAKADELRRAMSKKKEDVLLSYKEEFIEGGINKGYNKNILEEVYNLILKFANYGFNKAHSVSYAILGYKIAYLKANYPLYFEKEILNNNIGLISKTKSSINECKRLLVDIEKPNINISTNKYEIEGNKLFLPLSIIRSVGLLTAKRIVDERVNNKEFIDALDFIRRCYKLGSDVIKNIILSGALDSFGINRRTLIENLSTFINYAELCNDLDYDMVLKPDIKVYEEYSKEELTKHELAIYGFYISNHPTSRYINDKSITTNMLDRYFDKCINIVLYIERKKEIDTKTNEKMMFLNASDLEGNIELVMFPRTYNKFFNIVAPGIYLIYGKVEKRFSKLQISIIDMKRMDK